MGLLVDHPHAARPVPPVPAVGAIPFGIVCVLTFYTPDFSAQGKIIYACVTYILLTLVYTFVNVPYCAMPGVITADPKERHALQSGASSWRRRARSLSAARAAAGEHHRQRGRAGGLLRRHVRAGAERRGAALRLLLHDQERYTFEVQPGSSVAKDLKLLLGNSQWRIMCAFKMMATCSNVVRGGATSTS